MQFSVETWAPEYGGGPDAAQLDSTSGSVDVAVEVSADDWMPLAVSAEAQAPDSVCFVDGVRRIDARIWVQDGPQTRPGVCATVAAGAVRCEGGVARVVDSQVAYGVFASAESAGPILTKNVTYELFPVADDTIDGLYLGIHERMTALEASVSGLDGAELVIFDGPLRGRTSPTGVGFVKTQHVQYLPDVLHHVIGRLGVGERTPLFLINQGGLTRWSWYLRLPGPVAHPFSGIARCELPGVGSASDAAIRAETVTSVLPAYASQPHKDPRAPQNLYPIAGLERELRRRLGDPALLERELRAAARA